MKRRIQATNENRGSTAKRSKSQSLSPEWPEHFQRLFKIFKAINTVLAFVSVKRQLTTSFSAIRSSVEGILKRPLEIERVSEIKALLPDLVQFSYIPASELQRAQGAAKGEDSKTIGAQVLVLEFLETTASKRSKIPQSSSSSSPAAIKKLVETRNDAFLSAVTELLQAAAGQDPVELVLAAGRNYVPTDPSATSVGTNEDDDDEGTSNERPAMAYLLDDITSSPWYNDQIVYRHTVSSKEAVLGSLEAPLSSMISNALRNGRNISQLFFHQSAAIEAIRDSKNVIVSTSTASGKSVIYQVPVLEVLQNDPSSTAILIYPTKALAQDQLESLRQLISLCPPLQHLKVSTYDGDTPREARAEIRDNASVILTNFDTLHASILPHEELWRSFFKRLQLFAVDELHYYTGLLGSHIAYIMRRFRRICAALGNHRVQFISCSATLANPQEYMTKIFGLEAGAIEVISQDGAPSASKDYVVWNPPFIDPLQPAMGRRSSISEASRVMRYLMKKGIRVILFCKIRKVCELAMKTLQTDLCNDGRTDISQKVRSYRGGYTRADRRSIEQDAFSGRLLGIVATNALELGIDIGVLDAVIMLGFPMTISNFRQQAGRAGRRGLDSVAILVADPFPLDQYYVNHPNELFDSPLDDLIVDLDNDMVLEAHLQCASFELPLRDEDTQWFGSKALNICEEKLRKDEDSWFHPDPKFLPFPSKHVAIRGAQEELYMVVIVNDDPSQGTPRLLEEVEFSRALFELYEGGVFMHQGHTFLIQQVSHESRTAKVVETNVNYFTSPKDTTRLEPLQTARIQTFPDFNVEFGSK
ncbi:P-loop containing nucleoside triphosphate hydrolase protein [Panaeolus papilionaceus]|nr:P-loop containing nucleoside triphosphate hydrolase protein [Panaeolus papilionaceus]